MDWMDKFILHTDIMTLEKVVTARAIYVEVDHTGRVLENAFSLSRIFPKVINLQEPFYHLKDKEKTASFVQLYLTFDVIINRSPDINQEAIRLIDQAYVDPNMTIDKIFNSNMKVLRNYNPLIMK